MQEWENQKSRSFARRRREGADRYRQDMRQSIYSPLLALYILLSHCSQAFLIADGSTTPFNSLFAGEEFAADVMFDTEIVKMIVDAGSINIRAVETGFVYTDLDTGKRATEGKSLSVSIPIPTGQPLQISR
jgi:hypothetical protein